MEEQYILKYRVERLLGEGGMSRVYLGIDPMTGQRVAIKVLHPHLANHSKIRDLFLQEAESLAKLDHPDIVMLVDYNPEMLVLVQQYIDGMDLEEYITHHRGPIPEEEAKDLFCKLLEAFAYVHRNKVIHRDIKPANILITRGNGIKVVDFGIAKDTEAGHETSTGTRMGTVAYMSPEQIKNKPGEKIDQRTDIYSLGVLLHQMLAGKPPYDTEKDSIFDIQLKIVQEPLPRMQGIYEYVSKEMQLIVDKATAKDRNKRYKNCEEFLWAIRSVKPALPPKLDFSDWLRDRRIIAGVIVAVLLVGLGLFGLMRASKSPAVSGGSVAVIRSYPADAARKDAAQRKEENSLHVALKKAKSGRDTVLLKTNREPVAPPAPFSEKQFTIGEQYGGGIIFYVDSTGHRGLIVATSDMPGHSDGFDEGYFTWFDAKSACKNLVKNGHKDWRLPTKYELDKLFVIKNAVFGLQERPYWSSSESSATNAFFMIPGGKSQFEFSKSLNVRVRAVRTFNY